MTTLFRYASPLALGLLTLAACDDDDGPVDPGAGEEEVITTVRVSLTAPDGSTAELTFVDPDGDGGTAPAITGDTLAANTEYDVTLTFLNETETPAEDITEEIAEEGEEHQIFFLASAGLALTVTATDRDGDGRPVGLEAEAVAAGASSGTLRVVLRHEPDKDAEGVAGGDIANAGGETDVEVDFPVVIR